MYLEWDFLCSHVIPLYVLHEIFEWKHYMSVADSYIGFDQVVASILVWSMS